MSPLRFLLLEDSPLDVELLQASLTEGEIDCELVHVDTRDAYLLALEENTFDLILADYSLPTFDGVSALNVARSRCPNVPFIFVSAVLGEEVAIEMLKSGATDYVLKQRLSRLVPSVRRALQEAAERFRRQKAEEALRQQSLRSQILAEVSHALSEKLLDYQSVLNTIAQHCAELLGDGCGIRLLSDDRQWLEPKAVHHRNSELLPLLQNAFNLRQSISSPYYAQLFQSRQPVLVPVTSSEQLKSSVSDPVVSDVSNQLYLFLDRFPVSSLLIVPLSAHGRIIGTIGMMRGQSGSPFTLAEQELLQSLADRAALSIENARLYQESQKANQVKDQFLAVLSHELRSPLNPILGWTKLLQTQQLDAKTTQRALSIIERNAKVQTQLIDDLLDVSRILRGKLKLNVSSVNLADTVEAAFETVHLAATTKAIQIQSSLDPELRVSGDAGRLQQVFWNLLSNAIKFTPTGGQVEVKLEKVKEKSSRVNGEKIALPSKQAPSPIPIADASFSPTSAQITIHDTGKGINPELLPHVFDYFWQADSSTTRNFGGLGLGLAIVRHLVELHGGTVWAESPGEGQGATFIVQLPLLQGGNGDRTDQAPPSPSSFVLRPLAGVAVLAVDDEADMRELTKFVLTQAGATVTVAASANEALLAFAETKPDILVTDIGMPNMDGYMLLQQIRALTQRKGEQIPAIALTAYAGSLNRQQAMAAGFQSHLTKPIDPDELVKTIAALVEK